MPQDPEDESLRRGLEEWRKDHLRQIEDSIEERGYIWGRSSFGLKCAHETPGVFDEKFVESLWDELNSTAVELERLEREHDSLTAMDLPELIIEANRHFAPKQPPQQESVAATLDPLSDQLEQILTAWRDLLGIQLDPERVRAHLDSINKWQQQWRERRENAERS